MVDGDRWAFDELRRRMVPRVHGLIAVLLPHLSDSDEFVTQVFAEILLAAPGYFEQDGDDPFDWIIAVAQRVLLDRRRSERMETRAPVRASRRDGGPSVPALLRERYAVGPLLGVGGLARVYRGHDQLLGRDVAIKMFTSHVKDRAGLRVQESEARLLASQQHHGLAAIFDAGVVLIDPEFAQVYLVMELVRGLSLRDRLSGKRLSAEQVADLGVTLAEALEYVHDIGIVHRDVKPANVLLVSSGDEGGRLRAKLADFGLATLQDEDLPDEDQILGTPAYLSPEQVLGEHVGPESDVYQLGLVLLEALTGHVEYPGTAEVSALARLERDPAIPASAPPAIARTIRAMVERDPLLRASLDEVIVALRQFSIGDRSTDTTTAGRPGSAARRYDLFDTPPDGSFGNIAALAVRLCHAPIAIIRIVQQDDEAAPPDGRSTSVGGSTSFAVDRRALPPLLADIDPRDLTDAAVAARLGLSVLLTVPLITDDRAALGTLRVLADDSRTATTDEGRSIAQLAATVVHEMELRRAVRRAVHSADGGRG
ncbi:MAG: protein kinase [Acidobacteria bacterium]|nr:protein kinase [Acidobacteriota bacterium]